LKDIGRKPDIVAEGDLERDPSPVLRLSVVVPAHDSGRDLPHCIAALEASDLPRESWELIVIDDSVGKGPAFARNRGIEKAKSPVIAFVDADVMVHSDALRIMLNHFEDESVTAVFGSYDTSPDAPGIVSQYRNLLHAYVHQHTPGDVESFWAGCGAARNRSLDAVGAFNEKRFTRPEIEDVELGYRMRDAGFRIVLDPQVQCTHRKRWTLTGMVRSDFARRGVPWTRLLIERGELFRPRGLSLGRRESIGVFSAPLSAASMLAGILTWKVGAFAVAVLALIVFLVSSSKFLGWLARVKGIAFAIAVVPIHLIYNFVAFCALTWGVGTSPFSQSGQARYILRR